MLEKKDIEIDRGGCGAELMFIHSKEEIQSKFVENKERKRDMPTLTT